MATAEKDMRGNWRAEEYITLANGKTLHVLTSKTASGSVCTTAQAGVKDGESFSYLYGEDFRKTLKVTKPGRVTKGYVESQHDDCLLDIADVCELAEARVAIDFES
jgi:hypothetical protein